MVQELDGLARRLDLLGYEKGAQELREKAQYLLKEGLIPNEIAGEHLLPEIVFHHSAFTHYPQRGHVDLQNGVRVNLTPTENDDLTLLMQNLKKIVPFVRFEELDPLSPVKIRILHLRRKLEPESKGSFRYIVSVRGRGYRMIDPKQDEQRKG